MAEKQCPNCESECKKNGTTSGNTTNYSCASCWWESDIPIGIDPSNQGMDLSRSEAKELFNTPLQEQ